LFENSQKTSRAAQNVLTGHMLPEGRVFETLLVWTHYYRRLFVMRWFPHGRDGTGQHLCSPALPELTRNRPARLC